MNKTILVADDDTVCLKLVKRDLELAGYSVVTAANGSEALEMIKGVKPDLAILDINMPKLAGGEVVGELRDDPFTRNVPIIFLTSILSKSEEEKMGSLIAGNSILAKPYDPKKLLELVRQKI